MAEIDLTPACRRSPWALTFFGLLIIAALISMPFLVGPPGDSEASDFVRFIGHFHPVLLHLPIGVFSLILLQELSVIFCGKNPGVKGASMLPLCFGTASAVIAAVAGFLLYHGHGDDYGHTAIAQRHLWGGLFFAVITIAMLIVKSWTVVLSVGHAFYRILLVMGVAVMAFASHDGATMTHGENYLTMYAPDPIRRIFGLGAEKRAVPVKVSEKQPLIYSDIVAPILERRCVQCHKEGKAKGKLRMDTYEWLIKGGKNGPSIVPGSAANSLIIERIELPMDDEDHMPPEGKPDIEPQEIAILKWWIDSGADLKKSVLELMPPALIKSAIEQLPKR